MPKEILRYAVDEIREYNFLSYPDNPEDKDSRELVTEENVKLAAKAFGCSPALVQEIREALKFMNETIIEAVKEDLKDLYELANE